MIGAEDHRVSSGLQKLIVELEAVDVGVCKENPKKLIILLLDTKMQRRLPMFIHNIKIKDLPPHILVDEDAVL